MGKQECRKFTKEPEFSTGYKTQLTETHIKEQEMHQNTMSTKYA